VELGKHGPAASEAEANRILASVMRKVGDELGNTAAVARASYVSPAVVEHYLAGRTIEDFRPKTRRANLRADEAALVRMLRARPSRDEA
jgi:DNA topoisomerase-1